MQKRTYTQTFGPTTYKKPFKAFPANTTPMVLYRKPNQYSLTNPPSKSLVPEKKNCDVEGSVGTVGSWSELDLLTAIPAGAGAQERVGRKIQLKSMMIRWVTSTNASASDVRILVIYDRQPNGVLPTISEIVQGIASPTNPTYNAPMNLGNSDRFVVLVDEISHTLLGNAQGINQRTGKIYRKINLPMQFNNQLGDITGISTGSIYIMTATPSGTSGQGLGYYSRIRFTDV